MSALKVALTLVASLTSLMCMVLLFRAYFANGLRLLLWSALCFVCLSANNVLLFLDLVIFPDLDLRIFRLGSALGGVLLLLYGFLWEAE